MIYFFFTKIDAYISITIAVIIIPWVVIVCVVQAVYIVLPLLAGFSVVTETEGMKRKKTTPCLTMPATLCEKCEVILSCYISTHFCKSKNFTLSVKQNWITENYILPYKQYISLFLQEVSSYNWSNCDINQTATFLWGSWCLIELGWDLQWAISQIPFTETVGLSPYVLLFLCYCKVLLNISLNIKVKELKNVRRRILYKLLPACIRKFTIKQSVAILHQTNITTFILKV